MPDDVTRPRPPVVTAADWPVPDPQEPDYAGCFAATARDVVLILAVVGGGLMIALLLTATGY